MDTPTTAISVSRLTSTWTIGSKPPPRRPPLRRLSVGTASRNRSNRSFPPWRAEIEEIGMSGTKIEFDYPITFHTRSMKQGGGEKIEETKTIHVSATIHPQEEDV